MLHLIILFLPVLIWVYGLLMDAADRADRLAREDQEHLAKIFNTDKFLKK